MNADPGAAAPSAPAPERYVRGMERLVRAVTDLASARTLDQVTTIVRTAARELTGADGATFVLRDDGQCFYVDEDAIGPLWRGKRFPLDTCISGWAMLNKRPAVIPDIYVDDRIPHDAYRPTFVKSLVMVPVRTEEPVAAIGNYWADAHQATETEVRLLQALADSTAVALEHVRTLDELEQRVELRTAELRATNASLEQFAGIAAHDLRGPLDTMANLVVAFRRRAGDKLDEAESELLDALEGRGRHLSQLITALLDYARLGAQAPEVRPTLLRQIVDEAVDALTALIGEHGARVVIGDLPEKVSVDGSLVTQVVQNLIANAIVHGNPSAPSVNISGGRRDGRVEIEFADNGPGVPELERAAIFQPFHQGSNSAGSGSGLGLSLSRKIARSHGGDLLVADGPEGGAVFTLVLPDA